ncbi:hypothetical protein Chor_002223, partial [Crotalus horridus]
YENQKKTHGIWGVMDLMPHPNFSDVTGQVSLPKDKFQLPTGWQWGGEWSGAPTPQKEDILCPPGWIFVEEWKVEVNRAVDDAGNVGREVLQPLLHHLPTGLMAPLSSSGWEYGIIIPPAEFPHSWNAAEKTYHTHRRRRWLRKRFRNLGRETRENQMAAFLQLGVEVGGQQKKKKSEAGRKDEKEETELEPTASQGLLKMNTPLLFCVFKSPVYFQLRCYMYQARDLLGSIVKGTADPVAHISFLHMSHCTHIINGTLHPCWDETLLFEDVLIYGEPQGTAQDPPIVAVEIFDYDSSARSNDFMGRCTCIPSVCLDLNLRMIPRLQKYSITNNEEENGYLMAAFELLLDRKDGSMGKHPPPTWKDGVYTIPKGIRPILRLMAVEILAWGLRDMKNYNLMVVNNPSLIIECGGESIQTTTIRNFQEYPNFSINIYLMKVYLPVDEDYSPPIELKVIDHRDFGYKPVVGQATVRSLSQYYCNPLEESKAHNLPPRGIIDKCLN